jgi:hypothetical protein
MNLKWSILNVVIPVLIIIGVVGYFTYNDHQAAPTTTTASDQLVLDPGKQVRQELSKLYENFRILTFERMPDHGDTMVFSYRIDTLTADTIYIIGKTLMREPFAFQVNFPDSGHYTVQLLIPRQVVDKRFR